MISNITMNIPIQVTVIIWSLSFDSPLALSATIQLSDNFGEEVSVDFCFEDIANNKSKFGVIKGRLRSNSYSKY